MAKKCFPLLRHQMPINSSLGNDTLNTWRLLDEIQISCTNMQLIFPSFGRYDIIADKTAQKSEAKWPYPYTVFATIERTIYSGTMSGNSGNVLTDTVGGFLLNQFQANGNVAANNSWAAFTVSGSPGNGSTSIIIHQLYQLILRRILFSHLVITER